MKSTVFDTLIRALSNASESVHVDGGDSGFTPFLLASLRESLQRTVVVVTATEERAAELLAGIRFFVGPGEPGFSVAEQLLGRDVSPYHQIAPNRFVVMNRMATLYRMAFGRGVDFVTLSIQALSLKTLPKQQLLDASMTLSVNTQVNREQLLSRLVDLGYTRAPLVEDPGVFAVRGGIIDLYSPLYSQPVRIDFFDDEVESLRFFDPHTQRSGDRLDSVHIIPRSELVLSDERVQGATSLLRRHAADLSIPGPQVRALGAELKSRVWPLGVEGLLPAFYETPETMADYLPKNALWCVEDGAKVEAELERFGDDVCELYKGSKTARRIVYKPNQLYSFELPRTDLELTTLLVEEPKSQQRRFSLPHDSHRELALALTRDKGTETPFRALLKQVEQWHREGMNVVVLGASPGHVERLRGLFKHYDLSCQFRSTTFSISSLDELSKDDCSIHLRLGSLERGFVFAPQKLVLLGTHELLVPRKQREQEEPSQAVAAAAIASFKELNVGDLVVHIDHGIGRYEGLVKLIVDEVENDFLKLVYRENSLLYAPVARLDRIQKYTSGSDSAPKLDRLGGTVWESTKKKARKVAKDMARGLLALQAERNARLRPNYSPTDEYFAEFSQAFPFRETPDQQRAIGEVMDDMDKGRPMDRLVCGDVGYGKTEVAMRAAFRAILDNKQVAVLVPTTVLCEQHRMTFEDRFRGYPVTVAALSRFRSKKESKEIQEKLKTGELDVVIGTHRLLQKDVEFDRLGLLVVDEEHRFGVRHKEQIKKLKKMVDVLTLTATPIPRTLNMALAGIRDLSIIATPPIDRLSIRTFVSRMSDDVIREAISQELKRGGQVFFVHNRVQSIDRIAARVRSLMPDARVIVAHGQMRENELERLMLAFMAGEADVLVCTTIIESGLDVPRANTMLIDRADMLGLAQLYQLRGRVGRSNQRAYCYLLIPEPSRLTGTAEKRVQVIQRLSELGSGFHVATMDMEIRGAGNLLGKKQSGQVKEVGIDLFCELLADAVSELKGVDEPVVKPVSCEMKVSMSAFIPEEYLPDIGLRLSFYKRIATAASREQLELAFEDLVDRFGRPPSPIERLFELTGLKLDCQRLGLSQLSYNPAAISLTLTERSPLAGKTLFQWVQRPASKWRLTPEGQLLRKLSENEWRSGLGFAYGVIGELERLVGLAD